MAMLTPAGPPAHAQGASDTLRVVAEVAAACSLEGGTLNFGTYSPGQGDALEASTRISYECPRDIEVRIELDGGAQPNDGRRMAHDNDGDEFLRYELYQDAGRKVVWGGSDYRGDPLTISSTKKEDRIDVYGRILPDQNPATGKYTDVVRINLIVE